MCPQQHQAVFIVGLGGEVAGVGRLDGPAETAPEIQFPTDIEPGAVLPELAVDRVAAPGLMTVDVHTVGGDLLQLRVASALGDT